MGGWQNVNDCKRGVGRWLDHSKRLQTVNVVFKTIQMQMTVFVMIVAFMCLQKDRHSKAHKKGGSKVKDDFEYDEVLDEFDQDDQDKDIGSAVQMPVFENIRSNLASPFVSITDAIIE